MKIELLLLIGISILNQRKRDVKSSVYAICQKLYRKHADNAKVFEYLDRFEGNR